MRAIVGHNFSLKFPLKDNCSIPFSRLFNKSWKLKGANNVRFDFYFPNGYVRQTNKSLIVYPFLETIDAKPDNSKKLQNILIDKAFKIVKDLQLEFKGLSVGAPVDWKPSTQEYAIEDDYAKKIDFSFKNEVGQIDKSRHVDESGHVYSGGEIDWKSPEFADAYIKAPLVIKETLLELKSSLELYNLEIKKHLKAVESLDSAANAIKDSLKRKRLFKGSLKKSATIRGVS